MSAAFFFHSILTIGEFSLSEEEARHAVSVRRMFAGDELVIVDGAGNHADAVVTHTSKKPLECRVEVRDIKAIEPKSDLILAIAFPKGDRALLMLDMLAQLGVHSVIPLVCRYGEGDYSEKFLTKCQRVIIGAMKQSRQAWKMQIKEPMKFNELITQYRGFYAHPYESKDVLSPQSVPAIIAVGPEAGFDENEIALFEQNKWCAKALGSTILRIETAAVALSALYLNEGSHE